ncbi:hypothetical protein JIN84_07770 [Luteolibacter yonseiensis]|uniref:Uncharacterized protein n=1 Tax=Luteolibacter yonseiensis TaxID=1144680 RepID=A0A934R2Z6_9BACT|nr:hypothetical protein [Luteolibacter yonseiensis]MBK1815507.1 hypothetical protein [Luteolibacter yonseiensis]
MTDTTFRSTFPRQLRFWAFHCSLNALPSLYIALFYMGLRNNPGAIAAMAAAIGTFILLYATLTSLRGPLADGGHILSRSLRLGAKIRGWISALSLLLIWTPAIFFTPDTWCGMLAMNIFNHLAPYAGYTSTFGGTPSSDASSNFFPVYSVTLLEGFILSFLLLLVSFFSILVIQARDRREFFSAARKQRFAPLRNRSPLPPMAKRPQKASQGPPAE